MYVLCCGLRCVLCIATTAVLSSVETTQTCSIFSFIDSASARATPGPAQFRYIARGVGRRRRRRRRGDSMVVMGQLGRFVDGIKSKLRGGGGGGGRKRGKKEAALAAAAAYDKMDKTDSMRVEIRSRQAQKLIAKNLVAADSIGRRNKRFFLAF